MEGTCIRGDVISGCSQGPAFGSAAVIANEGAPGSLARGAVIGTRRQAKAVQKMAREHKARRGAGRGRAPVCEVAVRARLRG